MGVGSDEPLRQPLLLLLANSGRVRDTIEYIGIYSTLNNNNHNLKKPQKLIYRLI